MNETAITIVGWVGTQPELTEVAGGHQVTSFRVAVSSRRLRDGQWEDGPTTWHQVKAWRRLAAHLASSVSVGDPVLVHGRLVADVWRREDGTVRSSFVVLADAVGHDLAHGTTSLTRPERQVAPEAA